MRSGVDLVGQSVFTSQGMLVECDILWGEPYALRSRLG